MKSRSLWGSPNGAILTWALEEHFGGSGSHCMNVQLPNNLIYCDAVMTINNLVVGHTYRLSAWFRNITTIQPLLIVYDANPVLLKQMYGPLGTSWQKCTYYFTATTVSIIVDLMFWGNAVSQEGLVDSVSLKEVFQ